MNNLHTFAPTAFVDAIIDKVNDSTKKVNIFFDKRSIKTSSSNIPFIRPCMITINGKRYHNEELSKELGYDCIFINIKNNQVAVITDKYKYYVLSVNAELTEQYLDHKYYPSSIQFIKVNRLIKEIDSFRYTLPELTEFTDELLDDII